MAGLLALLILAAAALLIAAIDGKTQETREGARAALVVVAVAFLAALSNLPKPPQRGLGSGIHTSGVAYRTPVADWPSTGGGQGPTRFEPAPHALGGRSPGSPAAPRGAVAPPPALGPSRAHDVGAERGGHFAVPPQPATKPRPVTDAGAVERIPLNPAAAGGASFVGVQEWVPALSPVQK